MDVEALPYPPFVISNSSGLESDIIQEIGQALNITFKINIHPNATINMGEKIDGIWNGFLGRIHSRLNLGIGTISPEADLLNDFTYSVKYYWVKVVLVVPIAALVPR